MIKVWQNKNRRVLEIMLIVITIGMTCLVYRMKTHQMVVLNLFFLPIVLSGYYLGRTSAGVLAFLSALSVMIVTTMRNGNLGNYNSPVIVGLSIAVWGSVLGLTAILVGTLCDERAAKVDELHQAYVGVVEVLSKYLQSGNPHCKARSTRVAELCQRVAEEMKLQPSLIDDIRVGALLHDMGNVEITTKLISKAVDVLEAEPRADKHTFLGMDLVHSLGQVLRSAVPLVLTQDDAMQDCMSADDDVHTEEIPLGAKIIRAVRTFDSLTTASAAQRPLSSNEAIREMRHDTSADYDSDILSAIERCVRRTKVVETPESALIST